MFGFPFEVGVDPIVVNMGRMVKAYCHGVNDLRGIFQDFLTPETRNGLTECTGKMGDDFRIPDFLWVHLIYEFAAAYHHKTVDREHLMQSLVPLYLGRTASFILEVRESNAGDVEERIERLCNVFEAERPYLLHYWIAGTGMERIYARTT